MNLRGSFILITHSAKMKVLSKSAGFAGCGLDRLYLNEARESRVYFSVTRSVYSESSLGSLPLRNVINRSVHCSGRFPKNDVASALCPFFSASFSRLPPPRLALPRAGCDQSRTQMEAPPTAIRLLFAFAFPGACFDWPSFAYPTAGMGRHVGASRGEPDRTGVARLRRQ